MIDVCEENIWYKKKNRTKKTKKFIRLLVIVFLILGLISFYKRVICVHVFNICSDSAYSYSTDSINKVILSSFNEEIKYENLIFVEKNSVGDVVYIGYDAVKVNSLSRTISENSKIMIESKLSNGIPLHILAFSGLDFLSGYGKIVNLKNVYLTNVSSDFESKFISVGINQTLHSIYIRIKSEIILELPLKRESRVFETSVLIAETVLVGKVPEIYLTGKLFT